MAVAKAHKVSVSKGFATQLEKLKEDGVIEMPEISKLRKTAIREIDKGDRVDSTRVYSEAFAKISGTPKNKATQTFLETVRREFGDRLKAEKLGETLRVFFGAHADRLPADLANLLDVTEAKAFRVSATGGQGTGARELSLDIPTRTQLPDGTAAMLMEWLSQQPELKSTAKELKGTQSGSLRLWVRDSLDPNKIGWSTESATQALEQVQHPSSKGGVNIAGRELDDVIQALYDVNILSGNRDAPEWKQAKTELVAAFRKADAAGHVSEAIREDFTEIAALYDMPLT